ncbi:MAG: sigma-70 family RNA polymerase sigma factor [Capnocytophaga sp.]|nr:sigma-70 family RNA polymerase sigma factor [Capnocytophaga sp.]
MANSEVLTNKIKEARQGKQKAFSFLLDLFWTDVYAFQLKRTADESDAEDITVQTFARAFDKIDSYNEAFSFKTWLTTISKNIHIDMLRNRQNSPLDATNENEIMAIADESPTAEDQLITEQNLNRLLSCIKQLKEPYRTAIQLRYLQEKSYKEIAEETQSSLSNVKVTLMRAKKLLAEIIRNNAKPA